MFGELGPKGKPVDNRIATSPGYQQVNIVYATGAYPGVMANPTLENTQGCLAIGPSFIGPQVTAVANTITINSIAIGDTIVLGNQSVAVGTGANLGSGYSTQDQAVSIGYSTTANTQSVAIGKFAAAGAGTVSLGYGVSSAGTTQSTVVGYSATGGSNYSTAIGAFASGTFYGGAIGYNASANNNYASWGIGNFAKTDYVGQFVLSSGGFAAAGDAYVSIAPYRMTTTSNTATEIACTYNASTTPASYITLVNNATYMCEVTVVAQVKNGGSDSAGWHIFFMVQRGASAAATAIVGTPTGTGSPTWSTSGGSTWSVAVTADTTNGRPAIKVTGSNATTISWVANVQMTKVGY